MGAHGITGAKVASPRLFLHLLPPVSALVVAFGCTPAGPEPSSSGESSRSKTEMAGSELHRWDVIDHISRWKTTVLATEEPDVATKAGYVHVRVRAADLRPVDCFFYDSPIITGQALVRLLNAAEIGIDYQTVEVEAIGIAANNPLVVIKAPFREEEGAGRGTLFVGVVPRVKVPVVCSHESSSSGTLLSTLRSVAEEFTPASDFSLDSLAEGELLLVFELWTIYREGRPIGFRQWRAATNSSGKISTLEIASLLESEGAKLRATDVRVSEHADHQGLHLSDWLELVDGELSARAALQREQPGAGTQQEAAEKWSYRVAGLSDRGPVQSTIHSAVPFESSYFAHEEIVQAQAHGGEAEFPSFLPNFELSQATKIHYKRLPSDAPLDGAKGELQVGSSVFELGWEDGQLTSRKERNSGLESKLSLRLSGPL